MRSGDLGCVLAVRGSIIYDRIVCPKDYGWRLGPTLGGSSVVVATIG